MAHSGRSRHQRVVRGGHVPLPARNHGDSAACPGVARGPFTDLRVSARQGLATDGTKKMPAWAMGRPRLFASA